MKIAFPEHQLHGCRGSEKTARVSVGTRREGTVGKDGSRAGWEGKVGKGGSRVGWEGKVGKDGSRVGWDGKIGYTPTRGGRLVRHRVTGGAGQRTCVR